VQVAKKPAGEIESLLQEMQQQSSSYGHLLTPQLPQQPETGSFDDGNLSTTNLYVNNLALSVTEEKLAEIFGEYGDINSVKIMWPRTAEEKMKKRNCGFVSFMHRDDAADALVSLISAFAALYGQYLADL
jgi:U2-associated protein SR140